MTFLRLVMVHLRIDKLVLIVIVMMNLLVLECSPQLQPLVCGDGGDGGERKGGRRDRLRVELLGGKSDSCLRRRNIPFYSWARTRLSCRIRLRFERRLVGCARTRCRRLDGLDGGIHARCRLADSEMQCFDRLFGRGRRLQI